MIDSFDSFQNHLSRAKRYLFSSWSDASAAHVSINTHSTKEGPVILQQSDATSEPILIIFNRQHAQLLFHF